MNNTACRRTAASCFTLVELLVVILIISILASLLMPALEQALNSSRQVYCMNSQRQIGAGISLYTEAWRDWYPDASMADGSAGRWVWSEAIYEYMGLGGVQPAWGLNVPNGANKVTLFTCPLEPYSEKSVPPYPFLSYSINASVNGKKGNLQDGICFTGGWGRLPAGNQTSSRVSWVAAPSDTFLLVDNCSPAFLYRWWTYNGSSVIAPVFNGKDYFSYVHGYYANNWLFCDGHAELMDVMQSLGNAYTGDLATSGAGGIWTKTPGD